MPRGVNMDDQVFVPYTTVMKKLTGLTEYPAHLRLRPGRPTTLDAAAAVVTATMRTAHGTERR